MSDFWGEPIYSYTRKQAIEDGVLVDLSQHGPDFGIIRPIAITGTAWGELSAGRAEDEALIKLLATFRIEMGKSAPGVDRVHFKVNDVELWALCGPGDDGAPVLTIMLEGED